MAAENAQRQRDASAKTELLFRKELSQFTAALPKCDMRTTARSVNCVLAGLSQKKEEPPTHPADILLAEVRKRRKELWRQRNPELARQERESDRRTNFVSWVERVRSHIDWCQQHIERASLILEQVATWKRE